MPEHPKWERIESEHGTDAYLFALGVWVRLAADSRLRMTDGHQTKFRIAKLCGTSERVGEAIRHMVKAKLLDKVEDGYQIHDYEQHQETKSQVEERRSKDRRRKENQREKQGVSRPESERTIHTESHGTGDGMGREGKGGTEGEFFMLDDCAALFSRLRREAGGAGYKLAPTDYRRAESAVEWAREQPEPARACEETMRAYFRRADGLPREKGWPFWGWANDPGAWLVELGPERSPEEIRRQALDAQDRERDADFEEWKRRREGARPDTSVPENLGEILKLKGAGG